MTPEDDVDVAKLRMKAHFIKDENFHKKPARPAAELFAPGDVPEAVQGYLVGAIGVMANALDERGVIVASVSGKIIEHPDKGRLLCVGYAGANAPYLDKGLEMRLLAELKERIKALGIAGLVPTDEVAAQVRAWQAQARGETGSTPPK